MNVDGFVYPKSDGARRDERAYLCYAPIFVTGFVLGMPFGAALYALLH